MYDHKLVRPAKQFDLKRHNKQCSKNQVNYFRQEEKGEYCCQKDQEENQVFKKTENLNE